VGARSHRVIVLAGGRGDPGAIRSAVDALAADGRLEMPTQGHLDPVVIARWARANKNRRAVLRVAEIHPGQIDAVQARVKLDRRSPGIVDTKVHFLQPGLGLITIPTLEYAQVVEQRFSMPMHCSGAL